MAASERPSNNVGVCVLPSTCEWQNVGRDKNVISETQRLISEEREPRPWLRIETRSPKETYDNLLLDNALEVRQSSSLIVVVDLRGRGEQSPPDDTPSLTGHGLESDVRLFSLKDWAQGNRRAKLPTTAPELSGIMSVPVPLPEEPLPMHYQYLLNIRSPCDWSRLGKLWWRVMAGSGMWLSDVLVLCKSWVSLWPESSLSADEE